jgi:hypothetical protein
LLTLKINKKYGGNVKMKKGSLYAIGAGVLTYVLTQVGCAVQEVKSPEELVNASANQIKTYAQDSKLTVDEMRSLGATYIKIDDMLQDGVESAEKKKELETRKALLEKIINAYFTNGKFKPYAYVSGKNPSGQVKNNGGGTPLPTRLEEKAFAETYKDVRARAEYMSRMHAEWGSVQDGLNSERVDNAAFHARYFLTEEDTFEGLLKKKGKFGGRGGEATWSAEQHERYFNDDVEGNGVGIHAAFGLVGEDYTLSAELKKEVDEALKEKETPAPAPEAKEPEAPGEEGAPAEGAAAGKDAPAEGAADGKDAPAEGAGESK